MRCSLPYNWKPHSYCCNAQAYPGWVRPQTKQFADLLGLTNHWVRFTVIMTVLNIDCLLPRDSIKPSSVPAQFAQILTLNQRTLVRKNEELWEICCELLSWGTIQKRKDSGCVKTTDCDIEAYHEPFSSCPQGRISWTCTYTSQSTDQCFHTILSYYRLAILNHISTITWPRGTVQWGSHSVGMRRKSKSTQPIRI